MSLTRSRPQTTRRATSARCASLLLLLVSLVAGGAPHAYAATTVPLVPPISVSSVLLINASGSIDTLIVSGDLPAGTSLPARLELPIPSGSTPSWAGEIMGSDPAKDPTAVYTTRGDQGYDVVTLTLKQSRRGQVEVSASVPNRAPSDPYTVSLPVLSTVGTASIAFEVPAGSEVSSLSAGLVKEGSSAGADRYSLSKQSPRPGTVLRASLVVAAQTGPGASQPTPGGAASAPTQSSPSPTSATDVVLWGLLLGAMAFFFYNAYRFLQVRSARQAAETAQGAGSSVASARKHVNGGTASGAAAVQRSPKHTEAPRVGAVSAKGELQHLQDLRSRGAMSRQEFLRAKRELLEDGKD